MMRKRNFWPTISSILTSAPVLASDGGFNKVNETLSNTSFLCWSHPTLPGSVRRRRQCAAAEKNQAAGITGIRRWLSYFPPV